jgi:hypothetical protein
MSIEHRRLAARQWTAANVREDALNLGTRWKKLASWLLIVPTLSFFSLSLVAGAHTLGRTDYARAAKQLPRNEPLVGVAAAEKSIDNFFGWFTQGYSGHELCSVTSSQLAQISAHYQVAHMTITVDGVAVDVVTVSGQGANDHELRTFLGDPGLKCKLVRRASVFYLPFDAHGS